MPADLTAPAALKISRLTPRAVSNVALSKNPFTGQRQILKWPGDHWEFGITVPPLPRADADQVIAFLLFMQSAGLTCSFGPIGPEATPKGTALGTPTTRIAGTITGDQLPSQGWTPNQVGALKAGDWFQFGEQLCRLMWQADADESGYALLRPFPAPRLPYPTEDVEIVVSNPVGIFRLGEFSTSWDLNTAQHYGLGFTLVEAF